MTKVHYYPERRKNSHGVLKVKNVPILLFFSFGGKRLQFYTGERIDMQDWDFDNEKVLPVNPQAESINTYLAFLGRKVITIYRDSLSGGQSLSVPALRELLRNSFRDSQQSFFDFFIRYIEENHKNWTLGTYRKVKTLYNHLRKFSGRFGNPDLYKMDEPFLHSLEDFFRNECGHIDSTIRKNLELLYGFMNWAAKRGHLRTLDYRKAFEKFLALKNTEQESFCLTKVEINSLLRLNISIRKELYARDIYCLVCFTGLSGAELRSLRSVDIQDTWLKVNSGARPRIIPLLPEARVILQKYIYSSGNTVFPRFYSHKINKYLKELGKRAGILRTVNVARYRKGEKLDMEVEGYRLLTLSQARVTFIALALEVGMDPGILSSVAGYKTMVSIAQQKEKMEELKAREMKKLTL